MSSASKRLMVLDPLIAGVSGDMFVGALFDLGADVTSVIEAMKTPKDYLKGCKNLEITVTDTTRRGIHAKRVEVKAEEEVTERTGPELIEATINCMKDLRISDKGKQLILGCINTLVSAETRVHREETQVVHLHELASVDTLVDIIGAAVALDNLRLFTRTKVYSTPVAVGGGLFRFSHGIVSSPAPVTLEILRSSGFPMVGGPVKDELATPTGVSLLTNLAHEYTCFYPSMKPAAVGYGAGTKEFDEMPNVLRITLGEPSDYGLLRDDIWVVETNLDDVSGEIIGHSVDKLLDEGARDVSVIPVFSKKSRPGHIIKVIADKTSVERLSRILIEETGTLGVRIYPCERRILARESTRIKVLIGNAEELINVKVARSREGEIIQVKPEYDEVKKLANRTGKPLRQIMDLVRERTSKILLKGDVYEKHQR